jgi:hypothetical protein
MAWATDSILITPAKRARFRPSQAIGRVKSFWASTKVGQERAHLRPMLDPAQESVIGRVVLVDHGRVLDRAIVDD